LTRTLVLATLLAALVGAVVGALLTMTIGTGNGGRDAGRNADSQWHSRQTIAELSALRSSVEELSVALREQRVRPAWVETRSAVQANDLGGVRRIPPEAASGVESPAGDASRSGAEREPTIRKMIESTPPKEPRSTTEFFRNPKRNDVLLLMNYQEVLQLLGRPDAVFGHEHGLTWKYGDGRVVFMHGLAVEATVPEHPDPERR
jgi:hypothetical protein